MEATSKIFTSNDHTMIKQLAKYLKNKHIEFMYKNPKEIDDFIETYLNLLLKKSGSLKDKDWELACYLSFIFIIIFDANPDKIPTITLLQNSGRLFSASLILKVKQTMLLEGSPHIMSYLDQYYQQALAGFDNSTFYSATLCFYLLPASNFINLEIKTNKFNSRMNNFFQIVSNLSNTKNGIHYSNLLFISETISNILKSKVQIPLEYLQVFNVLFRETIKCPSIGLVLFFSNWLNFIKQLNSQMQNQNTQKLPFMGSILPQSESVSQLFNIVSRYKYNELITSFSWTYIYFYADLVLTEDQYHQQLRVINMISSIQKRVNRSEIFPYMNDAISRFSGTLAEAYKKKGPACHIFTLITSLEQTIESLYAELDEIQPIFLATPTKTTPDEKVYFIDQISSTNYYSEYDKELYTVVNYKIFTSAEQADAFHKKQLARADDIKSKLNTIAFYYFQLRPKLMNLFSSELKTDSQSSLFHYIVSFADTWVKFMIMASYKFMCLSLYKPSTDENYTTSRPERVYQYDLTNIFQKITLAFQELPSTVYKMIGSTIVSHIAYFSNKRMITLPFINILDRPPRERGPNDPPDTYTIIAYVVASMMSLTYETVQYFNSRSYSKAHLFYLMTLLTFRIGTPKGSGIPNPFFGSLTLFYFKVIVTSIFSNTKWMTNQETALKAAQGFIDAENSIHPELPQRKGRNSRMNLRIISFDDIKYSAKEQAATAFLDYFNAEADSSSIPIFMPAFEASLKSSNPETVIKAAKICHKFIVGELPNSWVDEQSDTRREFFELYFKSLNVLDEETAKEVIEDATICTPMFLQPPKPVFDHFYNARIPELGFNLTIIMQELLNHAEENEDHYRNIFAFLTNVFDYIFNNISTERQHMQPIMKSAIFQLLQCYAFDSMQSTVNGFVSHLNSLFAPSFAKGDFDLYFLCLLSVVGQNRSDIAQIATDILVSFLQGVKHIGVSDRVVDKIVVNVLAYFSPQTHMFSILTGLSLLNRFFPGCILLDYVRSLLVQLTDLPASETHFCQVLNEFLKNWLSLQTQETHKEFVMMIYDIVCPLSTSVRIILHQRTEKLNVKIPIHSFAEIDTKDDVLFFERITLAIGCGVEFDFVLNQSIVNRLTEITCTKPEGITILEHISRSLQLCLSSINHREIIHEFFQIEVLLSQFLNHICNSLTSHYKPVLYLAKKCVHKIKRLYGPELRFSQQIYEYCWSPEKIFTPFGPQPERIGFYRRLAKLVPDKASITIIDMFTNAIIEFEKKSNTQKLKFMPNFIQFIKMFTVRELMSIDIIHEKVCEVRQNSSNLQQIIDVFIRLITNPDIPFYALAKKYVVKMVRNFADEVVQYILFSTHGNNVPSIFFLMILIFNDDTSIIIKAIERVVMGIDDLSQISPTVARLVKFLVICEWYNAFADSLMSISMKLFNYYSDLVKDEMKPGSHRYSIFCDVTGALVCLLQKNFDKEIAIKISEAFEQPILMDTLTYHRFINAAFDTQSDDFKFDLFMEIFEKRNVLSPFVVNIFLSHCIIKSNHKPETLNAMLDKILSIYNEEKHRTVVIRCLYHLVKMNLPNDEKIKFILLNILKQTMSSPNPEHVIYSIRLSNVLLKKNKLPTVVYKSFLVTLLTFTKFLEPPYYKYLVKLVRNGSKNIENDPNEYISAISYYFIDKNMNVHDLIHIGNFLIQNPFLIDLLPFSFIGYLSDQLMQRLQTRKHKEDIIETNELFNFIQKLIQIVKPTKEEFQHFVDVSFSFISIFSQQTIKKDPSDNFYTLLANTDYEINLSQYFNLVPQGPLTMFSFGFICIMMKYISDADLNNFSDQIDRVFKYLTDEKNRVNTLLFELFCERVYSFKEIKNSTLKLSQMCLDELFTKMKQDQRCLDLLCDRSMILLCGLLKYNYNDENRERLHQVYDFVSLFVQNKNYHSTGILLVRHLLKCIEVSYFGEQTELVSLLLDRISCSQDSLRCYSDLIAQILRSQKISPLTKEFLLEKLPILLKDQEPKVIQTVIDYIPDDLKSFSLDLKFNLILAKQSSPTFRISLLDKIRNSLPNLPNQSIIVLCKNLTYEYWTDEFVPLIISLIAKKVKLWQPFFALSSYFVNIGSELTYATIHQIIDKDNADSLRDLYSYLVSKCETNKLSQMINGISRAFLYSNERLPNETVQFAASITGEFDTLVGFTKPDNINLNYLMPHRQNDTIFGLLKPNLSLREAAAMALTMLGQYDSASTLYNETEINPIISQMRDINFQLNISQGPINILDVIKPLIQIDVKSDIIVDCLLKASKCAFKNSKEAANVLIEIAEKAIIESFKNQVYISIYQKERFITISNILLFLKQKLDNKPTITFPEEIDVNCINPSFFRVIRSFTNILQKTTNKEMPLESPGDAIFFVENGMSRMFSTIVGYNSRGLVAISEKQVTEYFAIIQNLAATEKIKVNDMKQFAPFAFNFYEVCPSPEMYQTVFSAYQQILISTDPLPMFVSNSAAARIITLIRFAVNSNDQQLISIVESFANIFSTEQAVIWCVWLQQIVELSRASWFFEIVYHLFNDMSYRSTLYGEKLGIPDFKDLLQKRLMHSVTTQIVMMDILGGFVNTFLQIDISEYSRMKNFLILAKELSKLPPQTISSLDLIEIRTKKPIPLTLLEKAIFALTISELSRIDVQTFYNLTMSDDHSQLIKYIAEVSNSSTSLSEYNDKLQKSLAEVNKNLPFIISVRFDNYPHISIIRIHDDFVYIDKDIFVIHAMTSVSPRMTFLIQRSSNENGFHPSILTLSTIFVFFKQMIESSYQSRIRNISMDASNVFEIGKSLMLSSCPGDIISLETLFRMVTAKTKEEWMDEYTINEGKLNKEGEKYIETMETKSFKEYMLTEMAQMAPSQIRLNILRSFASISLLREIFQSKYPMLGHVIFCCTAAVMPILHVDFDLEKDENSSSFRLSPNIATSIGPTGPGELSIALSACASALVENLECVRSFVEVFVGDRNLDDHSIEGIKERKDEIIERLLSFAAPKGTNVSQEDAESWLAGIDEVIMKASSPENQPIEAIPWF
ncbi:hypothetical protein TVAG_493260 [Trichomonas vaginalis G3]|uniref:Uncharacterized protein n=1 Tax=Trichomonas vaginalis (strain ATCC PRA-98 / G3) TaxID=412133 RepID=A2F2D4_TRIV3|nr:hypothetical protein TVAGG3_0233000 [Trichomonas vaginalis G3]EAY00953.1 hypothetical protein TVAG_493260 [Trichomonas vaginalis G3]KAI5552787.1 hypothetical protein TVAGG3_0233000 [Trichomonas vaginalis G3]|eukprot:XP_001330038.1 hypothetical protein [Trichomonas vaginalis G3]